MKKEILHNLIKLKKLGNELGLFVEEVSIMNFYLDSPVELIPKKIIGINIKGGQTDELNFK